MVAAFVTTTELLNDEAMLVASLTALMPAPPRCESIVAPVAVMTDMLPALVLRARMP